MVITAIKTIGVSDIGRNVTLKIIGTHGRDGIGPDIVRGIRDQRQDDLPGFESLLTLGEGLTSEKGVDSLHGSVVDVASVVVVVVVNISCSLGKSKSRNRKVGSCIRSLLLLLLLLNDEPF